MNKILRIYKFKENSESLLIVLEQKQENIISKRQFCYTNGRVYRDNRSMYLNESNELLEEIDYYQLIFDKGYQKKLKNILKRLNNGLKYHYNNKRVNKDANYQITIQLTEEINNLLCGE